MVMYQVQPPKERHCHVVLRRVPWWTLTHWRNKSMSVWWVEMTLQRVFDLRHDNPLQFGCASSRNNLRLNEQMHSWDPRISRHVEVTLRMHTYRRSSSSIVHAYVCPPPIQDADVFHFWWRLCGSPEWDGLACGWCRYALRPQQHYSHSSSFTGRTPVVSGHPEMPKTSSIQIRVSSANSISGLFDLIPQEYCADVCPCRQG